MRTINRTKIEWCLNDDGSLGMTFNPISGCLSTQCPYCYARKIATRFSGGKSHDRGSCYGDGLHVLHDKPEKPFPFVFEPTYHHYRLDEPAQMKKPQTIFVGSMGDLFGDWIPWEWIEAVLKAADKAPWHRYIYLTKNPARYGEIPDLRFFPGSKFYGATATNDYQMLVAYSSKADFVSIEPMHEMPGKNYFTTSIGKPDRPRWAWVIVGAETGNRKGKIIPKLEWLLEIREACQMSGTPLFEKNSLRPILGDLIQEVPWRRMP